MDVEENVDASRSFLDEILCEANVGASRSLPTKLISAAMTM